MIAAAPARHRAQKNRGTLFVEEARVLSVATFEGAQFVIRLHAPLCAARATPGSFVHVQCSEAIPMRRPLSIMRASIAEGWIEVLFKIVGQGLRALSRKQPGDDVSIIGPIGQGFLPSTGRRRALLIGGGVGIPPMVFLAEHLAKAGDQWQPTVLMGSEIPFPFQIVSSAIRTPWLQDTITSTMPLMEQWNIPARLASLSGYAGTYRGYVTDLAREWLATLPDPDLGDVEILPVVRRRC